MTLFQHNEAIHTSQHPARGSAIITRRLEVNGMTCSHCEHAIAAELGTVPGIDAVDVDATTGIVVLRCSFEPDPDAIRIAVHDAGYDLR